AHQPGVQSRAAVFDSLETERRGAAGGGGRAGGGAAVSAGILLLRFRSAASGELRVDPGLRERAADGRVRVDGAGPDVVRGEGGVDPGGDRTGGAGLDEREAAADPAVCL